MSDEEKDRVFDEYESRFGYINSMMLDVRYKNMTEEEFCVELKRCIDTGEPLEESEPDYDDGTIYR